MGVWSRHRGDVAAAMVAICREETPHLPDDADFVDEFVAAVRHHRIAPLVHVALRDVSPDVAALLKAERDAALTNNMLAEMALSSLKGVLDDIPWATFKGAVLSEGAHPVPGLRTFKDVDVLVAPHRLREATTRLASAGWVQCDSAQMLSTSDTRGEMHWLSPSGLLIDFHWTMINTANTRHRHKVVTDDVLARRHSMRLGFASEIPVLNTTDALVHVCMHAGLSGAQRLLWMLDVDQMTRRDIDWDTAVSRAREWGAEASMSLVLHRAHATLGTSLPSDLNLRLGLSRGFRTVTSLSDRLSPIPRLRRDESVAKLVARAARPSAIRTIATIGRNGAIGLWTRTTGSRHSAVDRGDHMPASSEALDRYLEAVEFETSQQRSP